MINVNMIMAWRLLEMCFWVITTDSTFLLLTHFSQSSLHYHIHSYHLTLRACSKQAYVTYEPSYKTGLFTRKAIRKEFVYVASWFVFVTPQKRFQFGLFVVFFLQNFSHCLL